MRLKFCQLPSELHAQEFKEDLGATGENKTKEDKKEIKERDEDNLGLGRQKQDFEREQESKEIGKELNT